MTVRTEQEQREIDAAASFIEALYIAGWSINQIAVYCAITTDEVSALMKAASDE